MLQLTNSSICAMSSVFHREEATEGQEEREQPPSKTKKARKERRHVEQAAISQEPLPSSGVEISVS